MQTQERGEQHTCGKTISNKNIHWSLFSLDFSYIHNTHLVVTEIRFGDKWKIYLMVCKENYDKGPLDREIYLCVQVCECVCF